MQFNIVLILYFHLGQSMHSSHFIDSVVFVLIYAHFVGCLGDVFVFCFLALLEYMVLCSFQKKKKSFLSSNIFPGCGLQHEIANSKFIFEFKTHYFIV